jgi:hypothetical protein
MFLTVIQVLILVATIAIGVLSMVSPGSAANFTGLNLPGARGRTEVRAIFGGLFIGLGLAPLILRSELAYQTVAITYLAIAAARLIGLVRDRSYDRSNGVSLLSELAFGFLLLL